MSQSFKSSMDKILPRLCVDCIGRILPNTTISCINQIIPDDSCFLCLGILKSAKLNKLSEEIERMIECCSYSNPKKYAISIRVPFLTKLREVFANALKSFHIIECSQLIVQKFYEPQTILVGQVKEYLREKIANTVRTVAEYDIQSQYILVIEGKSLVDRRDLPILSHLYESKVKETLNMRKEHFLSIPKLESILKESDYSRLLDEQLSDVSCYTVSLRTPPIFLAGRYLKLCRTLPQTPWFDKRQRIIESSVMETISRPIANYFNLEHKEISFLSSGREDADAVMLGNGRPFILTLKNALLKNGTECLDALRLQNLINSFSKMVKVLNFQLLKNEESEEVLKNLKDGERFKTKTYTAYCSMSNEHTITDEELQILSASKDLEIKQKTPLRVLQRRSLIERTRKIFWMKTKRVSDNAFILELKTQAGTYVKEFVHGDLGRTSPSVSSLLKKPVDIAFLDVDHIDLDFPPMIEKSQNIFEAECLKVKNETLSALLSFGEQTSLAK